MRRDPGSCIRARQLALAALIDHGCTPLEGRVGAHVAGYGECCFQTDKALQEIIERDYGRHYHRESIGRARRMVARAGFIQAKRLYPGQRVAGMKRGSEHGTTAKYFRWNTVGIRTNPHTKRQRVINAAIAEAERKRVERAARPQHSAPIPHAVEAVPPTQSTDATLRAVLDEFINVQQTRVRADSAAIPAVEAGPIEAKAERDRGPP